MILIVSSYRSALNAQIAIYDYPDYEGYTSTVTKM